MAGVLHTAVVSICRDLLENTLEFPWSIFIERKACGIRPVADDTRFGTKLNESRY